MSGSRRAWPISAAREAAREIRPDVDPGLVISQDPAAGTEVELGTTVSYVESLGIEQVTVPEVRELSEADATAAIEAANTDNPDNGRSFLLRHSL